MIAFNRLTKVYACVDPVSMSFSYDGLFAMVQKQMQLDPLSGHVFLFVNKNRQMCKALYWDGTGLMILSKRLERGQFTKFNPRHGKIEMTVAELSLFFEGADVSRRFIESPREFCINSLRVDDKRDESMIRSAGVAAENNSSIKA